MGEGGALEALMEARAADKIGHIGLTAHSTAVFERALNLDWVEAQGGAQAMEQRKWQRANMLYDTLDSSKLFKCHAEKGSRSGMNVTFRTGDADLDAKFVAEATEAGFVNLKGHRKVGGMRASIYNAMPIEGVEKLCDFIKKFDKEN